MGPIGMKRLVTGMDAVGDFDDPILANQLFCYCKLTLAPAAQ